MRWLKTCTPQIAFQFERYAQYLYEGTILPLVGRRERHNNAMDLDDLIDDLDYIGPVNNEPDYEGREIPDGYDATYGGVYEVGSDDPPESVDDEWYGELAREDDDGDSHDDV